MREGVEGEVGDLRANEKNSLKQSQGLRRTSIAPRRNMCDSRGDFFAREVSECFSAWISFQQKHILELPIQYSIAIMKNYTTKWTHNEFTSQQYFWELGCDTS